MTTMIVVRMIMKITITNIMINDNTHNIKNSNNDNNNNNNNDNAN